MTSGSWRGAASEPGTAAGSARAFVVTAGDDGERVDRVVADRLDISRGQAQRLLEAGVVSVDGRTADKSDRVSLGARITAGDLPAQPAPRLASADVERLLQIRFADDHLLVVAKPAGLVVHEGAGTTGPTLVDVLHAAGVPLAASGDPTRPGIVHRLDRGTSGLLVVAKTEQARAGLVGLFSRHDVDRRYRALTDGVPEPASATIEAPIARDPARRTRFRVDPDGRSATSHYDVEEGFGRAALVTVRLETGRTHQVRVHMSAVGHPVCGDALYGADRSFADELRLTRPALHAAHLGFAHPVTGSAVAVDEPLPEDLQAALGRLRQGGW